MSDEAPRAPQEPPAVVHLDYGKEAVCQTEDEEISATFNPEDVTCVKCLRIAAHSFIELEAHEARAAQPLDWQPIPRLTAESREQKPFTLPVWGFAPSLMDPDFNPSGIVEMFYADDDGWIGAIWNGEQDCWDAKPIRPTYWLEMITPDVPTPALPSPPAAPKE